MHIPEIFIIIPTFLLFFVITIYILHTRGWKTLQDKYLFLPNDFEGEKIRIRHMTIDGLSHQNTIIIKISLQGLYMKHTFPFGLFSKPVLIPWKEIINVQDKKIFFSDYKRLVIGNPFVTTIDISIKDYNKISSFIKI